MRKNNEPEPIGHHLTLRCVDNRVIATSDAERRAVARCVNEKAMDHRMTAFGLVDTHLHVVNAEDRRRSGRLGGRIAVSIRRILRLPVRFAPVYCEPIRSQRHLEKSFFYDLRQQDHHKVVTDPYHDASNLPDLLGLRVLGRSHIAHVRALLPRVNRKQLLDLLELDELPEQTPVDWALLPAAAAAAACLPDLSSRRSEAVQARDAAVQVASAAGLGLDTIAELLKLSKAGVHKASRRAVAPDLARAVHLQLVLRTVKAPGSNGI